MMKNKNDQSHGISKLTKAALVTMGVVLIVKTIRRPEELELKNKVVLITGGGRGLGIILARKLADAGANVIICGRSEETLKEASADLASRTNKYLAVPCDITNKEQVKQMIQEIEKKAGTVDILINNAGVIKVGPEETMNQLDYEEAMNVHFWGPFYLINQVLPAMKEKKSGNIVNIVSFGGKVSFPHLLPYNASKYALSGLSEGLTAELRKHNIYVTTVYPGLMRTGSPRNIDVKGQYSKEYAWFKISDSLPFISIDAEKSAEKIIEAFRKGNRTLTLSIPAKIAVAAHGMAPQVMIAAFDFINFLLPRRKDGNTTRKGYESESRVSSSFLTSKTDKAAEENLEK